MAKNWKLFAAAWVVMLAGCLMAYLTQTAGNIEIKDVRFIGENGQRLSAHIYIPPGATAETPAPGILAIHGYINSREVQAGFGIEFARRGYVVLALDQSGHGYSEGARGTNGFGGPAALQYLRSLDIVDPENIGLEGHSMGGWAVLAAAAAYPDDYKAVVLEGSSTGAPFAQPGTPDWPRNLAVVFPKFDEFSEVMWGVGRAQDVAQGEKLQAQFGTETDVVEGQLYGDIEAGTARILHQPSVTHPGAHISHAAIGHAIDWFEQTLDGGTPIESGNQIWFAKEIGTLIAFVGFIMLLLGTFNLLLATPYFAPLRHVPDMAAYDTRTGKWWLVFLISTLVPVVTFYPLFDLTAAILPESPVLPQTFTTQAAVWAVVSALIVALAGLFLKGRTVRFETAIAPSILIALATIAVGVIASALADYFFLVDFRFWFVGLKPLAADRVPYALIYFVPFFIFFAVTFSGLHRGLSVGRDGAALAYLSNSLALMGGITAFLVAQYVWLFATGALITPSQPLNTVVFIQFVPILLISAIIGTYAYRRTASWLPGALISALFVTWYVVAGQANLYPI